MMKPIVFEKAHISAVEHKIGNGAVTSRIKVTAVFTPEVATAMEARWVLFDRDQVVKNGYKNIELDYELKNLRMTFEVPEMAQSRLQLTSELASGFKVMRRGDGKKKAKRLAVQFRIGHAGSPFDLLEYLIRIGGAVGRMELTALQQEMFPAQDQAEAATVTSDTSTGRNNADKRKIRNATAPTTVE